MPYTTGWDLYNFHLNLQILSPNEREKICVWEDGVKDKTIGFLLDLNTDHVFLCNLFLFLVLVN